MLLPSFSYESTKLRHRTQHVQQFPLVQFYSLVDVSTNLPYPEWTFMSKPFPEELHLLSFTLLRENDDFILFRMTNINEAKENPNPVPINDATPYFPYVEVSKQQETFLTSVRDKENQNSTNVVAPKQVKTQKWFLG
jgi:hypothetical protein